MSLTSQQASPAANVGGDELVVAGRDRATRNLMGLSELLADRPDLRGVHPPADLAYEAVRWSA
ncbi:MAG: hypothetical protein M3Y66_03950 [Actinomycetota bacterium]|nr:hypothetical protein [Actinomycetota bacterium]